MSTFRFIGNMEENKYLQKEDVSESFTDEEVSILKSLNNPEDITSVIVESDWIDDHQICMNLIVNDVKFSALWVSRELYAAAKYANEAESAKQELIQYIRSYVE